MTVSSRRLARRAVTLLFHTLLLTSCSPSELGADKLENYVSRLSNVSEIPIPIATPITTIASVTKPPAVALAPAREDTDTLSIIDFLALSGCELQANIAKRNTPWDEVPQPLSNLFSIWNSSVWHPDCIEKLHADDEGAIADLLETNLNQRSDGLVYTIAQAILGGEEWRAFWRAPEFLGDYPTNTSGDSAQTLWELSQRIKRFLEGNWSSADEDLEPLLARYALTRGPIGQRGNTSEQGLAQANEILITASEAGKYCSGVRQSEAGIISKTIVAKYFAGDVQDWSSAVSQRHYEIQTPVAEIEQSLAEALTILTLLGGNKG